MKSIQDLEKNDYVAMGNHRREPEFKETSMTREEKEYQKPKILYQVKVRKVNEF